MPTDWADEAAAEVLRKVTTLYRLTDSRTIEAHAEAIAAALRAALRAAREEGKRMGMSEAIECGCSAKTQLEKVVEFLRSKNNQPQLARIIVRDTGVPRGSLTHMFYRSHPTIFMSSLKYGYKRTRLWSLRDDARAAELEAKAATPPPPEATHPMTPDDPRTMPAGPDLDLAVARAVGQIVYASDESSQPAYTCIRACCRVPWHPSSDTGQALDTLAAWCKANHWGCRMTLLSDGARFQLYRTGDSDVEAYGLIALAACRAILLAAEAQKEKVTRGE